MQTESRGPKGLKELVFIFLIIISMGFWGGAWSSAKAISGIISSQTIVLFRFIFATMAVAPLIFIFKQSFRIGWTGLVWTLFGAALFAAYNQLFFMGIETGLAGAGGVLVTTTNPIFTYMITAFFIRKRMPLLAVIGLAVGFSGGFLMLRLWTFDASEIFRFGNGLFLISSVVWASVTVVSGHVQKTVPFAAYMFYFYLFATVLSIPFSLYAGDTGAVFSQGGFFWLNLLYLSFLAMAFSATIYFIASGKLGSRRASNFVFLVPVFAVFFSFLFLREIPTWNTIVGGTLAMTAVYILNGRRAT
ncbi:MAG: DMT family transporter, partial [Spirochaetia bacterium]